jgi:integrase
MAEFSKRFMDDYAAIRNKPRTVDDKRGYIDRHIKPAIGSLKVTEVTRADINKVLARLVTKKRSSDLVLACLSKMFNMAEVWLLRPEGTNPCRLIKKYNIPSTPFCFTDEEVQKIHGYLHIAETQGLEHPTLILATRLQFEFAGRGCEIVSLEWSWVNFAERKVEWPDSQDWKYGQGHEPRSVQVVVECLLGLTLSVRLSFHFRSDGADVMGNLLPCLEPLFEEGRCATRWNACDTTPRRN